MTTLGLDGWTVQSTAVATAPARDRVDRRLLDRRLAGGEARRRRGPGDRDRRAGAERALPRPVRLHQPGQLPQRSWRSSAAATRRSRPSTCRGGSAPSSQPDLAPGEHADLVINGIVGAADVWVNGTKVADRSTVQGSFARVDLDVTALLHDGVNVVALAVATNDPHTMLTVSTVDWTQPSPDSQTGIQFPVAAPPFPARRPGRRPREPGRTPRPEPRRADRRGPGHQPRHLASHGLGDGHDHAGHGRPTSRRSRSTATSSWRPARPRRSPSPPPTRPTSPSTTPRSGGRPVWAPRPSTASPRRSTSTGRRRTRPRHVRHPHRDQLAHRALDAGPRGIAPHSPSTACRS